MAHKIKGYGWLPDMPDGRDLLYSAPPKPLAELPEKVDLRDDCPAVYNQGDLGSCTANAIGAALQYDQKKQGEDDFTPSRLFIYYCERVIEHTVPSDSGAQIRDGVKVSVKKGGPHESLWPYEIDKFAEKPPEKVYKDEI